MREVLTIIYWSSKVLRATIFISILKFVRESQHGLVLSSALELLLIQFRLKMLLSFIAGKIDYD